VQIGFVSLFPEVLAPFLAASMLGRATSAGAVRFRIANPREFTYDRHRKVDETPYGGAAGMLLRPEPIAHAVASLRTEAVEREAIVVTSPAGVPFSQGHAQRWAGLERLIVLCGHYEGFDHRIETEIATEIVSIGDFVLTNGELPALIMADAVVRLLPGVLGNDESLAADSFASGLLGAPNYTRPEVWQGVPVPAVLRSGDHGAVRRWQRQQALWLTRERRPDLLVRAELTEEDLKLLAAEGDDRVELGRAHGRIEPEDHADEGAKDGGPDGGLDGKGGG
jgi:tRNA (guanine37-N1)-methyltransferase